MDIRRLVIYAGLAISSYMLILAWNQDYGTENVTTPVAETSNESAPDFGSDTPDTSDAVDADVPDVSDQPAVSAADMPEVAPPTGDVITVQTDVLNVEINPKGGQVVSVRLPQYSKSIKQKDVPFTLLENSNSRLFIAQSGLVGRDGIDKNNGALYSTENTEYTLNEGEDTLEVVLTHQSEKAYVEKIFTFTRGEYLMDVRYKVRNISQEPWQGAFYAQLKRDGSDDPSQSSSMGMQAYLGAALTTSEERYQKVGFDDLEEGKFKSVEEGGWAAILQHYFVSAWIPAQDQQHTYNGRYVKGNYIFGFYDNSVSVAPGETATMGAQLYTGPKIQDRLEEIAPNLSLVIDYGILWWVAQPLFWLLDNIHDFVGNWGVAIILLTVLIKLVFFKLSAMSYRSMANMRKVAPKMAEIKERYGDNREKLGQEMMKLYKTEKINPLSGCLPILVQMPVFIALYWVLMESVELRQAPFFLWIEDLSIKDPLFILPLLMGASMFIQFKLNPTPPDPMQARVMQLMPVIFTVFFLWFPAGLVLYWVVNNVLSIAQQYVITKQIEKS
ncbi:MULTISPECIES: membrane protein insertase YidC [Thalassolituus]|uniref:membrane protein insertase YidC n=1 Tax=Thalassolituus TaxID=187492 RepID=UPI000C690BD7|nr:MULTISPECIES: membrane protein insertase YidC [Thalassolituus]MAX86422.1 membrane protein insertase YidC [Oceanospirillaceae bacterium]|tara:strand:+ start:10430 stop:12097 length:1668 start_codon:yes stop_codon:yes gene_type:complete